MALYVGPGVDAWIKAHQATPLSAENYLAPDYTESVTAVRIADAAGQPVEGYVHYFKETGEIKYSSFNEDTPVPVPPSVSEPWDRVQLIGCGFAYARDSLTYFGVPRSFVKGVWHDTQGWTIQSALDTWNNSCAAGAQLVVGRGAGDDQDGECVLAVRIENIAYHAGTDYSTGRTEYWRKHNVNPMSIGVELCGFANDPANPYTDKQYEKCQHISRWYEAEYGVPRVHAPDGEPGWESHGNISNQRSDPGDTFDYDRALA